MLWCNLTVETDVGLSCFFSQHRPISITNAVPTPSTEASFNTIFDPTAQTSRKHSDVIYTLSSAVNSLEAASPSKSDKELRWEALQDPSSDLEQQVIQLDGSQAQTALDQFLTQFRPFNPPAVPVAFDDTKQNAGKRSPSSRRNSPSIESLIRPEQKSWSTTIVVTESTDANGTRTYTAATSPIVRVPVVEPGEEDEGQLQRFEYDPSNLQQQRTRMTRQPFLRRMWLRQQQLRQQATYGAGDRIGRVTRRMLLISVKRQRKLKMKKHKYKKLMKRTRNLRRRLERN